MKNNEIPNSRAFDPAWLSAQLETALSAANGAPVTLPQLNICQVCESSKRITILYDARIRANHADFQQYFLGILVEPERYPGERRLIAKRRLVAPRLGPPLLELPEADLILLAFPNDRHIDLLSPGDIRQWLQTNLPALTGSGPATSSWSIAEPQIEVLRYVPGKRFTARCRSRIGAPGGEWQEITFIVKQMKDRKKARRLFENLRMLQPEWVAPAGGNDNGAAELPRCATPRALGLDQERGIVFIEDVSGKDLEQALPEIDIARVMPAVGELLATFHNSGRTVSRTITRESELDKIQRAIRAISRRLPGLQPELRRLYATIRNWPEDPPASPALLHGTFRINHIFVCNAQLLLLDLDSVCMGNPAYDIANFISSLFYLDAENRVTTNQRQMICQYFLEGYTAHAPGPGSGATVMWYLADILIKKQAYKYMKHLFEDREDKITRMLVLADRILRAGTKYSGPLAAGPIVEAIS